MQTVVAAADAAGEHDMALLVLFEVTEHLLRAQRTADAAAVVEALVQYAELRDLEFETGRMHALIAELLFQYGEIEESIGRWIQAFNGYMDGGRRDDAVACVSRAEHIAHTEVSPLDAVPLHEAVLDMAAQLESSFASERMIVKHQLLLSTSMVFGKDLDRARQFATDAYTRAHENGDIDLCAEADVALADICVLAGDAKSAFAHLDRAEQSFIKVEYPEGQELVARARAFAAQHSQGRDRDQGPDLGR